MTEENEVIGLYLGNWRTFAALACCSVIAFVAIAGCSGAVSGSGQPILLVISPNSATGPDYIARGSIDSADDEDYYQLVLNRKFNTVVVMTSGDTDTVGQVETQLRDPISAECEGERHEAEPPCVWGSDDDIVTPNSDRPSKFNTMPSSKNFIWEGSLDVGTYYIRVTGYGGATGAYELTVELTNMDCPPQPEDPHGYYCDD